MTLNELEEELEVLFPTGFVIEQDKLGQVIIKTGLKYDEDDELLPLDMDEDDEGDSDLLPLDEDDDD
jgi:hypothetical protein